VLINFPSLGLHLFGIVGLKLKDFMISDLSSVKCFRVHCHGPELCCCKQVLGAFGDTPYIVAKLHK